MSSPSPLTSIRAITFDADDTLWPFASVMRVSLQHVIDHLAVEFPAVAAQWTVDDLITCRDKLAAEHEGNRRMTIEAVRRLSFVVALRSVDIDDPVLAEELSSVYFRHRHGDLVPFDDVIPMFDALDRSMPGLTIGLLTNGNTDPEKSGLPGRFDFRVHADVVGVAKPDPHLFELALKAIECQPHELLHVGDSLRFDIIPAGELGIRTAWLNRDGVDRDPELESAARPDLTVRTLTELPPNIEI